ncbi:MAG TPA: hypothetical protein VNG51_22865 [Ktedonobacteraceae bacterium]|nr:hypothetical protein [Ktedonobacteraceae bacterium]
MQPPSRPLSSSDLPDDNLAEDDIDQLYGNLKPVEPPPTLIARILANVSQLSQAEAQNKEPSADEQGAIFDKQGNLIVRNEKREPS